MSAGIALPGGDDAYLLLVVIFLFVVANENLTRNQYVSPPRQCNTGRPSLERSWQNFVSFNGFLSP